MNKRQANQLDARLNKCFALEFENQPINIMHTVPIHKAGKLAALEGKSDADIRTAMRAKFQEL